ncbi:YfjI family protein [Alicyclobacillus sendaiensis]|uniref:YfjI family protein n=1 Tax=Alicyclobacillus sendaiensis TaxID=192387 RepID=UPI0026F47135|nr:YfjI family protein [Alicyclobacillus sendaiensis]
MNELSGIRELQQARQLRMSTVAEEAIRIPFITEQVLPFPDDVLPKPLWNFAVEVAEHVVCPNDYVGMGILTVAGALLGNSVTISTDKGWRERARIWTLIVGDSGSGKSPAIGHVMKPVEAIQSQLAAEYRRAHEQYKLEAETWTRESGKPRPVPPPFRQVYVTDTTVEALMDVFVANPRGVLVHWDEAAGFVNSFGQYKGGTGSDKQQILSLWNDVQWSVNRKGRAPLVVEHPFMGFLGGIQPETLAKLRGFSESDGFAYRFLVVYPDGIPRRRSQTAISEESRQLWDHVCRWLWGIVYDGGQCEVTFAPDGIKAWNTWLDEHYEEMNDPDFPPHLNGTWSKLDTHALRLTLVVHLLRAACGEIDFSDSVDEETMARVAALMQYLKSHARRVYQEIRETEEDRRVRLAVRWIQRHQGRTTLRDLVRSKVANCKTVSDAIALLRLLEHRGHVVVRQEGKKAIVELVGEMET